MIFITIDNKKKNRRHICLLLIFTVFVSLIPKFLNQTTTDFQFLELMLFESKLQHGYITGCEEGGKEEVTEDSHVSVGEIAYVCFRTQLLQWFVHFHSSLSATWLDRTACINCLNSFFTLLDWSWWANKKISSVVQKSWCQVWVWSYCVGL